MTLMLDPTVAAPSEDETQSLHAWSQEDDVTEVVDYRPRSWKLPALVALLAASAAVTAGLFLAWPQSAGNPQVTPSKPQAAAPIKPITAAQTPDQRFIALVQQRGFRIISEPLAIKAAHAVCVDEHNGYTDPEIAQQLVKTTPGADLKAAAIFVDTAHEVFCP
jgi:Protein of unknown function (DUF732)